ncbi:MAG TPA: porin [Blastocatellia bacterium]|nr:porin [Blastocatellia bacterium]
MRVTFAPLASWRLGVRPGSRKGAKTQRDAKNLGKTAIPCECKLPYLSLALVAILSFCATVRAQESPATTQAAANTGVTSKTAESSAGKKDSSAAAGELKAKIEQLTALIEKQQQALAAMEKRISEMEAKGRAISQPSPVTADSPQPVGADRKVEAAALETAQKKDSVTASARGQSKSQDKPALIAGWDRNRAVLRSPDGDFETTITGYGQLDFRGYQSGNHPPNTFLLRRARLVLEGKLQRYFDFKIEGDLADTAGTILRDFYGRIHRIEELQFTFGQFRVPYSQEEIRSDAVQDFVERSLVNNLAPSRSPGVMFSGVINKGVFEYQVGAFNGKGLLAANNNGTPETALRLRFAPWKNNGNFWTKGFIFGGAVSQGRSAGGMSVRGQTESRSITFFAPDPVNGKLLRTNGEFTWLLGPAAIRAEYDQTNQERENLGPDGTNLPGVVAKGYMGQFTYLLTGEAKPEAGAITPKRSLFGEGNGMGLGAWELKFRYANLQISDATANSNRAETFFFGTNWYLNRYVRHLLDFGIERFKDPLRTPNPGDRSFFVVLSRLQVAF